MKIVTRPDGSRWKLVEEHVTSDGFRLAAGILLDPETDDEAVDESGFPVIHDFFLGAA